METLKEISLVIASGQTVYSGGRPYVLKEMRNVPGGLKAVLTSDGFIYTNYEPADTKEIAVYRALLGLQDMGCFMQYRSEESILAVEKAKNKKTKPVKIEKPKPAPIIHESDENGQEEQSTQPSEESDALIDQPSGSPIDIETRTIIKIVTRMS